MPDLVAPDGDCIRCRLPVIVARTLAGSTLLIERCELGQGTVALTPSLFPDGRSPLAELVSNGTTYRAHGCQLADLLAFMSKRAARAVRASAPKRV